MTYLFRLAILVLLFASAGCSQENASSTTCALTYPRGTEAVAPPDVLTQASSDCTADTGPCMASSSCVPFGPKVCDPAKFATADAAICVARSSGLEAGLETPGAGLVYDFKFRRVAWGVSNVLFDADPPAPSDGGGGTRGGQYFQVDAVNLAVLSEGRWEDVP